MKSICCLLCAIILFGCHSDSPASTVSSNKTSPAVTHDTILWIGKSARWKKTAEEIYDGSYDTVSSYFMPCGKTNTIKVSRDQIYFDLVSNCDSSFSSKVRLFDLARNDSIPRILPHKVVLTNAQIEMAGNLHFTNGDDTITLKPAQVVRLEQAAAARNELFIEKQKTEKIN